MKNSMALFTFANTRKPESSALASCSDINNIADSLGEIGFSDLIRNNESNLDPTRLLTVFGSLVLIFYEKKVLLAG